MKAWNDAGALEAFFSELSRRAAMLEAVVFALDQMYMLMYIHGMPRRYTIAEARSRLPTIINEAEAGADVELTRRGEPVAVVVSLREFERLRGKRRHFRDAYRKFLETHSLEDVGVDHNFANSTRDRTLGRKVVL